MILGKVIVLDYKERQEEIEGTRMGRAGSECLDIRGMSFLTVMRIDMNGRLGCNAQRCP